MKVLVVHGPDLDRLGTREPHVYGSQTLEEVNDHIREVASGLEIDVDIYQTAEESGFVRLLEAAAGEVDGAILNPAALSHTSRAIADAVHAAPFPVVEVHLSNIHAREPWRRRSVTAEAAVGVVAGFKADSYALALKAIKRLVG